MLTTGNPLPLSLRAQAIAAATASAHDVDDMDNSMEAQEEEEQKQDSYTQARNLLSTWSNTEEEARIIKERARNKARLQQQG